MSKTMAAKLLSNTTYFSDNLGTYIANGQITTNQITTNGDIILTGSITNGSNSITFTENTLYTNIPQNFFINGTGLIQYQGVNYNIGQVLSAFVGGGTVAPYPSITYDSSLNTTTFTGNLVFPATSISSASINNSDFATISTSQTLSNKEFTGTIIFSSIQLNSNLIVNAGGTTILNSNLALINFLSGTSTNIDTRFTTDETNISTLLTRTTNISYNSTGTLTTIGGNLTITNAPTMSGANISAGTIPIAKVQGVAVNLNGDQIITGVKQHTGNIRLDANILCGTAGGTTILNSTLVKLNNISDTTSAVGANLTSLQTQINSINTDLDNYALQSALQAVLDDQIGTMIYFEPTDFNIFKNIASLGEIQYTDANNNKINIVPIIISSQDKLINVTRTTEFNYFDINSNVHIFNNLILGNIQNVESLINAAMTEATAGLTAAVIADGLAVGAAGVAAGAASTAAGAVTAVEDLALIVEDHTENLIGLNNKTSQISYSDATDRTTISQTLYSPYLEVGNIESGFNQTTNDQVTFTGEVRCNNRVEINNTLELINNNNIIVEGIINQDNATPPNAGVNQFQAPTNFNGNCIFTNATTTINATTMQIGTSAVSTLNCNSSAIFGGDITMSIDKNLTLKNIVPILLDSIYFGAEAGVYINDDVVFNMKIEANRPVQISNTCQIGTNVSRNTLTSYNTTTILDSNTSMTLTTPVIGITSPSITIGQNGVTVININGSAVSIGQLLGVNTLYGTTYVQSLQSLTGVISAVGQTFQQF